jgi:hypothetical protein
VNCVAGVELRIDTKLPDEPDKVKLLTVVVVLAGNVI